MIRKSCFERHYAAESKTLAPTRGSMPAPTGSNDTDGIHLGNQNHERLGVVVAQQVRLLLA